VNFGGSMDFENLHIILLVLLGVSESLALIPALKANGILDMFIKILKALVKKDELH
jgi:hypothetical protein